MSRPNAQRKIRREKEALEDVAESDLPCAHWAEHLLDLTEQNPGTEEEDSE